MFLNGHSRIISVGIEQPPERVTSRELMQEARAKENFGISDMYLERLTGIVERRRAGDGVEPSDLAVAAARQALERAGVSPSQVQFIVYTGVSRDHCVEPSTAHNVQRKLGASNAHAFDVSNACLGFMNGILAVDGFLGSGARYGLVVTGEKGSMFARNAIKELRKARHESEFSDLLAGLTLGDVGAAFLLGRKQHPDHGFSGFEFASDGNHSDLCWCGDDTGIGAVHTDMPALLKEATDLGVGVYNRLIDTLKWSNDELRWYIPHQIGKISFKIHTKVTGIPASKMPNSYEHFGNLITGNIPMCVETIDAGNGLSTGDKVWMAGAGSGVCAGHAGLVWG